VFGATSTVRLRNDRLGDEMARWFAPPTGSGGSREMAEVLTKEIDAACGEP
jgi:hypothetical protein